MSVLDDVKTLLGLDGDEQDAKLTAIISLMNRRLCALIGQKECPSELEYIVTEVSLRRFNRIGSEGMTSHGVEGESISYQDNDFSDFMDDIEAYRQEQDNARLRIRFL